MTTPTRWIIAGAFGLLAILAAPVSLWIAAVAFGLGALVIAEGFDA